MSNLLKNLLIAFGITILLGVVYFFVLKDTADTEIPDSTEAAGQDITLKTADILANTQKIRKYTLDTSLFSDTRFATLKDSAVVIPDVSTGRKNPFEPIK